jgi:hypothetical protein
LRWFEGHKFSFIATFWLHENGKLLIHIKTTQPSSPSLFFLFLSLDMSLSLSQYISLFLFLNNSLQLLFPHFSLSLSQSLFLNTSL